MGQFPGNFRALDVDQFSALMRRLDKIGNELERFNDREEALSGKVTNGPSEQGPVAPTDHTG